MCVCVCVCARAHARISEPGGHEFDHIRFSAYFAISGLFFLLQQKYTQDHPQRIVAFPFIDVCCYFIYICYSALWISKSIRKNPLCKFCPVLLNALNVSGTNAAQNISPSFKEV